MHKLLKAFSILLAVFVLVSSLTACYESAQVLLLGVVAPRDGATVTEQSVVVNGTVNKSATVTVNGTVVPVKKLQFSTSVTLAEGQNIINVEAQSGKETVTKILTVTYTPTGK
ncbi:MAG: hypothetical protein HYX91_02465 [Chloroflexi bacterium]|nr:hypothetical protein [Chloroflexota bacterium]